MFSEHLEASFSISEKLSTDNGPQLLSKLFVTICSTLRVNKTTTTGYHTESNCQAEPYNSTFVLRLRQCFSDQQMDWDAYLLPLLNAYNVRVHRTIEVFSFSLTLKQTSREAITLVLKRFTLVSDEDATFPAYARFELVW